MAFIFNADPVEITGITHDNNWNDIDLTSFLSTSGRSGIMIEILNISGNTTYDWGVRANGGTGTLAGDMVHTAHSYAYVPLDGNDIIELKSENSNLKFYIIAECDSDVVWKSNPIEYTPSGASSWVDVDITANVEAGDQGNIVGAIIALKNTSDKNRVAGLRKNGSTFNVTVNIGVTGAAGMGLSYWIVGVDSSDIFEVNVADTTDVHAWLVGYIKTGVTFITNPADEGVSTLDAWTDLDITSATSIDAIGAWIGIISEGAMTDSLGVGAIRKNGSALSETNRKMAGSNSGTVHGEMLAGCAIDTDEILEYYIHDTDQNLYTWAYVESVGEPATAVKDLIGTGVIPFAR